MTIKVVLDTNVLISGIFWNGPPFKILEAWHQRLFTLVLSSSILEEYRRVAAEIGKKKHVEPVDEILGIIETHSVIVKPTPFVQQVCKDGDDDKFLEAAVAAKADYVVTGDAELLRVRTYETFEIIRPTQFLRILGL